MTAPRNRHRILVRSLNWLGDVVMSLPAIRAVRRAFPDGRVAVLARRELASFFSGDPGIDEVIPFAPAKGLGRLASLAALAREIRGRRFDLAVVLPRSFESALAPALARVPERVGYRDDGRGLLLTRAVAIDPAVEERHQVHRHLHLVREGLGVAGSADDFAPAVAPDARQAVERWLAARRRGAGPLVALAPGAAYGPAKEWPAEHYATLVDRLAEAHGAEAVLVGAPSERAKCEEVAARSRAGALVAAGETTVGELVALLAASAAFAGNDSGAMHVAGALGRPTVGIYGSTSPERTGPLGARRRVLHDRIECSPCYARVCRFGHTRCLAEIAPARVASALEELGAFA